MRVWIEQEYCTGDGLCAELCPDVFAMDEMEGLAYVRPEAAVEPDAQATAGGEPGTVGVVVGPEVEEDVLEAQVQCAGECIFVSR